MLLFLGFLCYTDSMKNFIDLKCDYNLYKSFYAVAKLGGFSAAAKVMYVSQPSISYNVKMLEKQLGVVLFYRNSKNISLTPEGKKLYKFIEDAHNVLISGEKMLLDSSSLMSGELSIGAPTHVANFYLIELMNKFKKRYPNIVLKIFSRSTKEMVEMLNDNILDLIVDNLPIDNEEDKLDVVSISNISACFAYSPDYTLSGGEDITSDDNFILPNPYTVTRKTINSYLKRYNVDINCGFEVSTTETTLAMVLKGMGIGYFLEPSIKEYLDNGKLIKLEKYKDLPTIELGYAYNKRFLSTPAQRFIEIMEENKFQN